MCNKWMSRMRNVLYINATGAIEKSRTGIDDKKTGFV